MKEQEPSGAIDNPEVIPSADSPTADVHDQMGSTSRHSLEPEEKRPTLGQRLAEAFREGVASARPDYEKRSKARISPDRRESGDAGILDREIQEGRSAAAVVGDKAVGALDSVGQLVKKVRATTHKYAEAFREGAASVKPREGRERREVRPPGATKKWLPSDGGVILDRVFQSVGSAAEILRGAVKPGKVRGAWHEIRICKEKIRNLYVEIGREVANSWDKGAVETERVAELLEELRKNEEKIQNLQEHIAEVAAARKMEATRIQQAAKEAGFTPASPPASEHTVEAGAAPQEEVTDTDLLKKR